MAAYIIARVNVKDPATYQQYTAQTPGAIARFGGRFIARGGRMELLEGNNTDLNRTVLIEFPSYEQALNFYHSAEYQEIVKLRWQAADSQVLLVEGV
ncbi:MAG: DUF1330 domain-containing protein [Candidatus Competibacteraceae bacterium]|nr:DUF1330 domain-containing protein [Candidatus Competibacteraceae bacterium]MCB1804106.1 DUF1330 domain-containing protein [Candidatus Competibacteraceae bacterium]MCB1813600.1 DUF1330 domain-containing protein [Candidatus Competibacteraceae bacterium]